MKNILLFIQRRIFWCVLKIRVAFFRLLSNASIKGVPVLNQPMQTVGFGEIEFLGRVNIGVFPSPFFLSSYAYLEVRNSTSRIVIGNGTWINNGFSAIAEHTFIKIGEGVLIGINVEIVDSDFHGIKISDRGISKLEWASPVNIQDNVWLGSNVRVYKGVTIGAGSIVANSSVVVSDIPAGVIAAGNPARVIRRIEDDK